MDGRMRSIKVDLVVVTCVFVLLLFAQVDYGEGARIRDPSQLRDRIRCESLPSVDAERGVQLEVM
jgi:hypothetical protein